MMVYGEAPRSKADVSAAAAKDSKFRIMPLDEPCSERLE
ncbi:hypothetical protein NIT7321_02253 [Phaeobacter italicus]|jgi:hypothetical protein|uniref:Uncharacterized protein n=1 Tax=Phaeobacter italicus TaxID=481446 RepID=A0A0H5D2H3_9RHOB|nr:hypothetical protein NIT7321_02253 [Phaeobacter italicus]